MIEGKWKFRFDVDYEDTSVTLGSGETFQQDGLNSTITGIRVSPIAVQVSYEADSEVQWTNAPSGRLPEEDRHQADRYLGNIQILLVKKDGSVIDMSSSDGSIRPENGRSYCTKGEVLEEVIPWRSWRASRSEGSPSPSIPDPLTCPPCCIAWGIFLLYEYPNLFPLTNVFPAFTIYSII